MTGTESFSARPSLLLLQHLPRGVLRSLNSLRPRSERLAILLQNLVAYGPLYINLYTPSRPLAQR